MKTVKETNYVHVSYDEELKLVDIKWLDKSTSEEYRNTWIEILEWGQTNKCVNLFSDITNQNVVSPIDRKWFEDEIIPKGIEAGIERAGIVIGGSVFKRYYFNNIMAKTLKHDLPFKAFATRDDAIEWFKTFQ